MTITQLPAGDFREPIVIENQAFSTIRGEGIGRTFMRIDGPWAIEMRGKVGRIEISDLTIVMNGKGSGVGNNSGVEIGWLRAERIEVMNGATAISGNADLGGFVRRYEVLDCWIHDMPGEVSGSGYGIHSSNAESVAIRGNLIERCGRHSIYQARSAKRQPACIQIINNVIREHRAAVNHDGGFRCAIVVTRSSGVVVAENQVIDGYDGALEVSQDGESVERPWPADSIDISNNQFFGRKNVTPYVLIGEQKVPPQYVVEDVSLSNNRFDTNHDGDARGPDVLLLNGRHVSLSGNHFRHRGDNGMIQRCITLGDRRMWKSREHVDDLNVSDGSFTFDAPARGRPLTIDLPPEATKYVDERIPMYIEP